MTGFRPTTSAEVTAGIAALREALRPLAALRKPDDDDIHTLRLLCKRLRAAVRLLRAEGNARVWRRCDHALRDLARHYGTARDASVLRDSIALLATGTRSTARRRACRRVLAQLPAVKPVTGSTTTLRKRLWHRWLCFDSADCSAAGLRKGWRASVQRCRKAARPVLSQTATVAQLHRYRKHVKTLAYQLALVHPAGTAPLHRLLSQLGHLLGTLHDLAQLEAHLPHQPGLHAGDTATLTVMAQRRRQSLTRVVFRSTLALFALLDQLG